LAVQTASLAPFAIHFADTAAQLSSKVTIYTHGNQELSDSLVTTLGSNDPKFHVDSRTISSLSIVENTENNAPVAVNLEFVDGTSTTETILVHNPFTQVKGPFVKQLGIETTPSPVPGLEIGDIAVNPPTYQTNVRQMFVVPLLLETASLHTKSCQEPFPVDAMLPSPRLRGFWQRSTITIRCFKCFRLIRFYNAVITQSMVLSMVSSLFNCSYIYLLSKYPFTIVFRQGKSYYADF
jgi:hypothetical protein